MISQKYKTFYLGTAKKQLKKLSSLLLSLEKNPEGGILIENIFRLVHSMKGAAATMAYKKTVTFLHALEDVVEAAYHKQLSIDQSTIDLLFKTTESLEKNLKSIAKSNKEINLSKETRDLKNCCKHKTSKQIVKRTKSIVDDVHLDVEISVAPNKLNTLQNYLDDLLINVMKSKALAQKEGDAEMLSMAVSTDTIVNNLRRELERLRIVPLSDVLSSLPYLVRSIAKNENKQVELNIKDNDLSLDKSILDQLVEILIQLLKNAVAHGIQEGQRNGRVDLEANLLNDQMQIIVKDNGQGVKWQEILDKAIKKKVISRAKSKKMTLAQIKELIFMPGISAAKASNIVSGRGMGLSLVKNKVEDLDGDINVDSSKKGTTFTITIPLPLSIFRSFNFQLGQFNMAIPLLYVNKVVKLKKLKNFYNTKTFDYKRSKYKVISLAKKLDMPDLKALAKYVALLKYKDTKLALPVYSNVNDREVVMKKSPHILKSLDYIKGVAVASDGQVILILDINNLI